MILPSDFTARASNLLNLKQYSAKSAPIKVFNKEIVCPYDNQYILRMMIASPHTDGFQIPEELCWLRESIAACHNIQKANGLNNPFVYVTVRHGIVNTVTDDDWHVDGFSMRVAHVPEQNYVWSNTESTEYQDRAFDIPDDFDPLKHNLHTYLSGLCKEADTKQCEKNTCYLFDPYFVHRRPKSSTGQQRTFWRISFIPIEIEDDTCMANKLLKPKRYNRTDIRESLTKYTPQN